MSHALTLTLPDELYESIRRNAQATNQPIEALLLSTLRVSLPSLEDVPVDTAAELVRLEALDDDALRAVVHEKVGEPDQDEIESSWRGTGTGPSPTSSRSAFASRLPPRGEADRELLAALPSPRGVSDFGDGKLREDKDSGQRTATRNAAQVALKLLSVY